MNEKYKYTIYDSASSLETVEAANLDEAAKLLNVKVTHCIHSGQFAIAEGSHGAMFGVKWVKTSVAEALGQFRALERAAREVCDKSYLRAGKHEDCHTHPALIENLRKALPVS